MYVYTTFPMDACNYPGALGLRGVLEQLSFDWSSKDFQSSKENQLGKSSSHTSKRGYTIQKLGEGRILADKEELFAVLVWMHVDDILIHGPSKEKLITALEAILSTTIILRLICQPCKNIPPSQVVRLGGFLYNTRLVPVMTIPSNTVSRVIVMINYLIYGCNST